MPPPATSHTNSTRSKKAQCLIMMSSLEETLQLDDVTLLFCSWGQKLRVTIGGGVCWMGVYTPAG